MTTTKSSQQEEINAIKGEEKNEWCGYKSIIWSNRITNLNHSFFFPNLALQLHVYEELPPRVSESPRLSTERMNSVFIIEESYQNRELT